MERPLVLDRFRLGLALVVAVAAPLGLAACGRAGGLDPPPAAATPAATPTASAAPTPGAAAVTDASDQGTVVKNGFDSHGNPIAPAGEKKSFFLDFLLN